jgi:uncharacterized protein
MERCFEIPTAHGTIRGARHAPPDPAASGAVVVLVHGYFSSNRIGPIGLYVQVARRLCEAGHRVYRADALGVGESDGDFSRVSLPSVLRDFAEVCAFALREEPGRALVLMGHSMGANVALLLARELGSVAKVLLLAPAVAAPGETDTLLAPAQVAELRTRGWTLRKGLRVHAGFLPPLRERDPVALAAELEVPVVVFQGDADELYRAEGPLRLAAAARHGRSVLVRGADHNFLDPAAREELLGRIPDEVGGGREASSAEAAAG